MADIDFPTELQELRDTLRRITEVIDLEALGKEVSDLEQQAADPNLWDNQENAQRVNSQLSHKQAQLQRIRKLAGRIDDVEVMVEMGQEEGDADTVAEAAEEVASVRKALESLEIVTLMSGEYDEHDAVVTIRAGAGGVDAADFSEMLLRMYTRWAENRDWDVKVLDTSYAEEAGLKSATFEIKAPYAFGTLSVEAGTHRLVRISPFDNQGRRQTSFAAVEVIPLIEGADSVEIDENDLQIDTFRSSGPGGQSVNTTDSAVRITHKPTGVVVSMQNEKSQIQNRAAAMRVLEARLLLLQKEQEAAEKKELAGNIKASWGDQIRSYVLHPYQMVKDLRTGHETGNADKVLNGELEGFIESGIRWRSQGGEDSQ